MKEESNKLYFLNINEFTVFYFIWLALIGQKPKILSIDPYIPPIKKILEPVITQLINRDRASYAYDYCPEFDHIREVFAEINLYNIFEKIESWQNKYFSFSNISNKIPDYAMAYKHLTCNYIRTNYFSVLLLDQITQKFPNHKVILMGLLPSTVGALDAYSGRRGIASSIKFRSFPWVFINIVTFLFVTLYSICWATSRIRLIPFNPKNIFFAADFIDDPRDLALLKEVSQLGDLILVQRSHDATFQDDKNSKHYLRCNPKDGNFDIFSVFAAIGLLLKDSARLFWIFNNCEPAHYFQISTLPFRRIVLRALFNKFRPAYFWGRDDYNVEHILRRQELHRFGGISLGISHGMPTYANLVAPWRYISFDRYYTFGRSVYEIYKETWANDMEIVPVGSFGIKIGDYKSFDAIKPKDIAVFCAVFTGNAGLVKIVRGLANTFPDRTIWLQIKFNYRKFKRAEEFIDACTLGLDNVVYTTDSPYSLFSKVRYAISDASTTVIEALQFGVNSYMADVCEMQEVCHYREFSGLCFKSVDTIVDHIVSLETGRSSYLRESYGELVDLSKRPHVDIILEDIQLFQT